MPQKGRALDRENPKDIVSPAEAVVDHCVAVAIASLTRTRAVFLARSKLDGNDR